MNLPLSKIKVLDVSQIMAGPFCCMLLGDMGADVIKVEAPGAGDQTRKSMGFRLKGEDSGGFLALNRNKRSVEIDLKTPSGQGATALRRKATISIPLGTGPGGRLCQKRRVTSLHNHDGP